MDVTGSVDLVHLVAQWRRRRQWRHLLAMLVGALGALSGSISILIHVVQGVKPHALDPLTANKPDSHGLPVPISIATYVVGCLFFAWGGAAGTVSRLPRWVVGSLIGGFVSAIAVLLYDLGQAVNSSSGGGGGDGSTEARTVETRPHLASALLTRFEAEQLVGSPVEDPIPVLPRASRRRSRAIWRRHEGGPRPRGGGPARDFVVEVRTSTMRAAEIRAGRGKAGFDSAVIPRLGDGGMVLRHTSTIGTLTSVQGTCRDWIVALNLRAAASAGDPSQIMVGLVGVALARLDHAERAG